MAEISWILIAVIVLSLAFDFVNGFHDAANAIATVVSTRTLSPRKAVTMAACLDFTGAFVFTGVAHTISSGLVTHEAMDNQALILAAIMGAICWNLLTWYWGLPASSSHALIGGLVGVAMARIGWKGVIWGGVVDRVILPGLISPLIGLVCGYLVMLGLYWLLRNAKPSVGNKFRIAQIFSSAFMAFSHGANDAQKVMGIITLALYTAHVQSTVEVHWLTKLVCAAAIASGTSCGGWRIVKTIGSKVVKLQPINGFAADTTSSCILITTAALGMPISTTHVITSVIMGVGAVKRLKAVRWSVGKSIIFAWTFTMPAAAVMSALAYYVMRLFVPGI